MQIQINEQYRISSDSMNVTLEERKFTKPTEDKPESREYHASLSYHANLEQACMALLRLVTLKSDAQAIQILLQEQHEIKRDIVAAIDRYKERVGTHEGN